MIVISLVALSLSLSAPVSLQQSRAVVSVPAKGSGELRLAHRYHLGDLASSADATGRGMLIFPRGRGTLMISGPSADQLSLEKYRLRLDVFQVTSMAKAQVECTMTLSPDHRIYRALDCEGIVAANGERFRLLWRGVEAPATPLP